ncbi:uncharacterized protein LOC131262462 isoform X2 [Anopheles coustani]|uniref:uncharacterized protein LOC131262462 isoform X2 n=2 Tax=coustani group TaxID=59130 RepID=UPI00265B41E4|nr:uncharacterized protein LOC131262462 isoform X2 [Anopheles coustani]
MNDQERKRCMKSPQLGTKRKIKKTVALSEEATLWLIKSVHDNECLWNRRHTDYKNKDLRAEAWETISSQIGLPTESVKDKWISIQSTYRKYRSNYNRSIVTGEDSDEVNQPTWFAYKSMSFLGTTTESYENTASSKDDITHDEKEFTTLQPAPITITSLPLIKTEDERINDVTSMGEASTSTSTSGKEFTSVDMECGREGTIIGESSSSISAVWKAFNPEEDCSEEMTGSDNDAIAGGFRKAFESDEDRLRAMTTIEEASASVSGLNTQHNRYDSECVRVMTNIGESMEQWSPKRRDRVLIKIKRIVADEEEGRFKDHYGHSP